MESLSRDCKMSPQERGLPLYLFCVCMCVCVCVCVSVFVVLLLRGTGMICDSWDVFEVREL